jgi:UDP-N-acetyl-D-mannosaminuronic acid dehydrogenase
MPSVLHLKPEEIDTVEKRGKYTVNVVGCGQRGILYAIAFADAGFKVICTDADQSLVKHVAKGKTPFSDGEIEAKLKNFIRTGQLNTTNDLKSAVFQSDVVVMTIAAKIDNKKSSDYSEMESSCKQVGAALRRGTLFIYGCVAGFGFTEGVVKEVLENTSGLRVGEDFGLVYNPTQISEWQPIDPIASQELKVAAIDKTSLEAASILLAVVTKKGVRKIQNIKTAELAALFMSVKKDANRALANEFAVFCESAGLDYFEVLELLETQGTGFSPTIEEEENRNEAYLLLESAENLNTKLRLPRLARQINEDMVRHAINLIQDTLRRCGKTLRRARVAVLGTAQPGTATDVFVKLLVAKGAKTSLYDPTIPKNEPLDPSRTRKRSLDEAVEGSDCIVILAAMEQFKRLNFNRLKAMMRMPAAIVDLIGIIEPQKVEKEGFLYRGLGRGVGKK